MDTKQSRRLWWATFGVMGALASCGEATTPEAGPEANAPAAPPAEEAVPNVDAPVAVEDPQSTPSEQTLPLVRRAELREAQAASGAGLEVMSALPDTCQESTTIAGQLDASSRWLDNGSFGFVVDAYVVTALQSGPASIASRVVEPLGGAYQYGYGYPLSVQRVEAAALPSLSTGLLIAGAGDDALNDGVARADVMLEAGAQYVVVFKGLVGTASEGTGWRYALGMCGERLRVDGKLWVSSDPDDRVPAAPLSGLISRENAPPGVMGALAQTIVVR